MNLKTVGAWLAIFFCISQHAFGQVTVAGVVSNRENNEPIHGASITVVGSPIGASTDSAGRFSIKAPSTNSKLAVSYVGFAPTEFDLNGKTDVIIQLSPADVKLDEVVVVGYGTAKESNLTGSVSVVSNKDIAHKQVGQTSMALQGVVPGLTITQSSGQPGNDACTLRIRGIGTLGTAGQAPLVLVDGVEMGINNIDPNDIETISVLKDASSAAIYGSRAANGVIIVTTKRAKSGRIGVNYNSYVGKQKPISMPKLVSGLDHMLLLNEAKANMGQAITFPQAFIDEYIKNAPSDLYPDTDWQDLTMTGSGLMQNHSIDVSGGTNAIKVRASFNRFEQKGVIPNTGYNRSSLRINTDIKASDKIGFKVDLRGNNALVYQPGVEPSQIFYLMNGRVPAIQEGVLSNGNWGQGWLGDNSIAAANASGRRDERTYSAIINLQGDWKPFKGFNINLMYAPEFSSGFNKTFRRSYQTYYGNGDPAYMNPSTTNSLSQTSVRSVADNIRALLTYETSFGNHDIKVLGGYEQIESYDESYSARRENFLLQNYPVLNNGSLINQEATGSGGVEYGLTSYFGRVNYSYLGKYLLEANLRYDGSSRFAEGNKFGLFPSFSAGWRISEEDFLNDSKVISNLKLRASYGQLGNQNIGNYPFASSVDLNQSYLFNNLAVPGAAIRQLGNPDISWETTEMFNVGVDARLFNKLTITAEYYIRNTKDILLSLPIPYTVGLDAPYQNAGKVKNTGWDLGIGYNNRLGELDYSVNFVLSDVRNEVVDLEGTGPYIDGNTIRKEGYPIDAFYGYQTAGLFQTKEEVAGHATQFGGSVSPGDIKYVDQNKDGIINPDDRVILGSAIPRYTYSMNLNLAYKGFDFTAFVQGVGKVNGYLSGEGVWAFQTGSTAYEHHLGRWTPANTAASYPRLAFGDQNNIQASDYWMLNGAYLRVKNLQLGYSLPKTLLNKTFIKNIRLNISGQNLFTIDNFLTGFDVETPAGGIARYPIVKIYSFGINANF